MARLTLRVLGPFEVFLDDEPVTAFDYNKLRALLAYLAIEADRPHPRDALADLLWPERPGRAGRDSLRQALSKLRRTIGDQDASPPYLLISRDTVQLDQESDYWLDAAAFSALLAACDTHRHRHLAVCASCLKRLEQAVALYRGDLLEGVFLADSTVFEEWALFRREEYRRRALEALRLLAMHHERRGEYQRARSYARRQLELEPWAEEAHRQVMRTLALEGQRSAALTQYAVCRRILAEELSVEPEGETAALYERIRDGHEPATPTARPYDLPAQLTPFVGRQEELGQIGEWAEDPDSRLLTLVGAGGFGKTRLALQAATEQREAFPNDICFVALAAVRSAGDLPAAIADALHLSLAGSADVRAQLFDYLRDKEMLLVLDSFEHLLEGSSLLSELLHQAPSLKLLVTSRENLHLQAESILEVRGMPYPHDVQQMGIEEYDAVRLFLQHARRVRRDFSLSPETVSSVIRICQLTEGMPLGLELAAGSLRVYSCEEIVREIEHNLDFLATAMVDVPERHHSLRAVFEHSWCLLSEEERRVFRRLSIFQKGFRREAVEAVTGASIPVLRALVNKSLLGHNLAGRYTLHPLLQQYAAGKLQERPQEREQALSLHSHYYAVFLHEREKALRGSRQAPALQEIAEELENVRPGWQRAVEKGSAADIDLSVESLVRFCEIRGLLLEGEQACERAAEALRQVAGPQNPPDPLGLTLARVTARQGALGIRLGRHEQARGPIQASLAAFERFGAHSEMPAALIDLGDAARMLGDEAEAERLYRQALEIAQELRDPYGASRALSGLGAVAMGRGGFAEARQRFQKCVELSRGIPDQWGIASALANLGEAHASLGQPALARASLLEALELAMEIQAAPLALRLLVGLAALLAAGGKRERAVQVLAQVLDQPSADRENGNRARQLLAELRSSLTPRAISTALEQGRLKTLAEAAEELLAEA